MASVPREDASAVTGDGCKRNRMERRGMLISGGTVVTGDGAGVIAGGYVRIRDGRIVDVGAGAGPQEDDVIDASAQIVIPGIINTHSHGCVEGPFVPVGSPAFSRAAKRVSYEMRTDSLLRSCFRIARSASCKALLRSLCISST